MLDSTVIHHYMHCIISRVYDREESIERRHTVHQMYAEGNVTSCICHKL